MFGKVLSPSLFNFGDNVTVHAFWPSYGCARQYTKGVDNHLRGVTPQGTALQLCAFTATNRD